MAKQPNGKGNNHGFGIRRLTSPATQDESILVEKSVAIAISDTRLRLSILKYRVRRVMCSFPETAEEVELYKLVFQEIDEVLQRSQEELSRADLRQCQQYISLAKSFITDAETKIGTLTARSRSLW